MKRQFDNQEVESRAKKAAKKFFLKIFALGKPMILLEDKEAIYSILDESNQETLKSMNRDEKKLIYHSKILE